MSLAHGVLGFLNYGSMSGYDLAKAFKVRIYKIRLMRGSADDHNAAELSTRTGRETQNGLRYI